MVYCFFDASPLNLTKHYRRKYGNSEYVITQVLAYMYGIAARAASQAWLGMGGQGT